MRSDLENSDVAKVSIGELEGQVLSPNEASVSMVRIARQARRMMESKRLFRIFRHGENEVLIACKARWDAQWRGAASRPREEVEHLSESQEVLTDLMVRKKDTQRIAPKDCQIKIFVEFEELEVQKAKEALTLVQKKHKLIKWECERERARTMQRLEASRASGPRSGGHDNSSCGSCSASLALHTDEAMSARWSIDLEREVEKLEVRGPWSVTQADSVQPKGGGPQVRSHKDSKRGKGNVEGRSVLKQKAQKGKVVREELEETQRPRLWEYWQSVWKKQRNSP